MPEHCAICGKPFGWSSKPRWTSERGRGIIGYAHSTCTMRGRYRTLQRTDFTDAEAGFAAWALWQNYPYESDPWWATLLAHQQHPSLTPGVLQPHQEERLAWWETGPMHLGSARAQRIREAYDTLLQAYQATVRTGAADD